MSKTLKAAVVGTGGISQQHLAYLSGATPYQQALDSIQLAAVCDLSPASSRFAAQSYGVAQHFTDIGEMLQTVQPDVVHILTPATTHIPLATMALKSGADVICEKPITGTSQEAADLYATTEKLGRRITESHNYRFNDEIVAIKEAIDGGELGDVKEVEIRICLGVTDPKGAFGDPNIAHSIHKMPAGVIHDFTTHFSYLMLHLSQNAMFDTCKALWLNQSENPLFRYDNLDAILYGKNANGPVHGRIRFDAEQAPDTFSITVRGSQGFIETDLFQPHFRKVVPRPGGTQLSPIVNHVVNGVSLAKAGVTNFGQKIMQKSPYHGLHASLDATYLALLSGDELPVTKQNVLDASQLVDLLLEGEKA